MKPVFSLLGVFAAAGIAQAQVVPPLAPRAPQTPRAQQPRGQQPRPAEPRTGQPQAGQPGAGQPRPNRPIAGQQAPAERTPAFVPITAENVRSLADFTAERDVKAISLAVTQDELKAAPGSQAALQNWVRGGGVVFLHTDAAELFDFDTVEARESTPQLAGQLFGKTRAAIPFGAHPLLWGVAGRVDAEGQPAGADGQLAGASAVRTVYYSAQRGDCFVTGHPRGVPLLQIVEPAGAGRIPEYAAAIAPFGRGWAIVTPNFVEPGRGDGAVFAGNLLRFAGVPLVPPGAEGAPRAAPPADPFVSLPASWLESAADAARTNDFDGAAVAQALVDATPRAPAAGAAPAAEPEKETEESAPLALRTSERNDLWRLLRGDATAARTQVLILRARLALQNGDIMDAAQWLDQAADIAPNAAATQVWGGVISASRAADRTLASPARALLLQEAVGQWNTALDARPDAPAAGADAPPAVETVGGVPREMVALWMREAAYASRLAAAEPPLVTLAGNVIVRFYVGDASLRLALPSAERLQVVSRALGVAVDDEELLLFSTPEELVAYKAARGGPVSEAGAYYGDVSGSKILMVSRPATILFLPPLQPGGARRPVQTGTSLPILIGRLHGRVLINSITGGDAPIPAWLQLGVETLVSNQIIGDETNSLQIFAGLREQAALGTLLTPAQFEALALTGGVTEAQARLAEAQALSMVQYFARQIGPGTLVEVLQRLGAGQELDGALDDTAELTEATFFTAWSRAMFPV